MSLTYGIAALMCILRNLYPYTNVQSKFFTRLHKCYPGRGHTSVDPLPLKQHPQYDKCILVHKVVHNKSPAYVRPELHAETRSNVNSRNDISVLLKKELTSIK